MSWDEVFEWNESLWFHIECFELQFKETTLGRKVFMYFRFLMILNIRDESNSRFSKNHRAGK